MDLLILAAIAIFLVYKLYSIFGQDIGHRRKADFTTQDDGTIDTVLESKHYVEEEGPQSPFDNFAELEAPVKSQVAKIHEFDPNFNYFHFIEGLSVAFKTIVEAFAQGDTKILKPLVSREVLAAFTKSIEGRRKRGETWETEVIRLKGINISNIVFEKKMLKLTLSIESEQATIIKNSKGQILSGHPESENAIQTIKEQWTFARDVTSSDPNWLLVSTHLVSK